MKKGWKIFWITVATIAMVGLTLGIVSSVMGFRISDFWAQYPNGIVIFGDDDDLDWDDTLDGDNDSDWDDADEDEFQDSADALEYENIKELEVSVGCCEVVIVPGEDEKFFHHDKRYYVVVLRKAFPSKEFKFHYIRQYVMDMQRSHLSHYS